VIYHVNADCQQCKECFDAHQNHGKASTLMYLLMKFSTLFKAHGNKLQYMYKQLRDQILVIYSSLFVINTCAILIALKFVFADDKLYTRKTVKITILKIYTYTMLHGQCTLCNISSS